MERQVQIGENLTPETKAILHGADTKITKQNLTKLSRLEPEQQEDAAAQLAEGKIKSVDEYTAQGKSTEQEQNYYLTGAFVVEAFTEHSNALARIPDAHRSRLEHYREMLSHEQIKELIGISNSSLEMLREYINFLNNELEVSE